MLIFTIDRALAVKDRVKAEKWFNLAGISLLVISMVIIASQAAFTSCTVSIDGTSEQFDFGCLCSNQGNWAFFFWFSLYGIGALATLAIIVRITVKKCKGRYKDLRNEFKLAFVIYRIPAFTFCIYALELVLKVCQQKYASALWEPLSVITENLLFVAPIVILVAVLVYRREFMRLQPHLSGIHYIDPDIDFNATMEHRNRSIASTCCEKGSGRESELLGVETCRQVTYLNSTLL